MKIAVVGAGSVGKVLGGLLQAANHDLHYLVRSEYSSLKSKKSFTLFFQEKNISLKISPIQIYNKADQLPKVDIVLVTTKTTENQNLAELITPCLDFHTLILVVQNGIGNEEALAKQFPNHPIICCITSMGAIRAQPEWVDIAFLGEFRVAALKNQKLSLLRDFCDSLEMVSLAPQVILSDNHRKLRWHKLIWNVAFNPLSVLFSQSADVLATQEPYRTIVLSIFEEVRHTAEKEDILISDDFLINLLNQTGKNIEYWPSMHYDYIQKKPLEIEYILDNLLKIADQYNLVLPCVTLMRNHLIKL